MKSFVLLVAFVSCHAFDLEQMMEKESKKDCSKNGKNYRFGEEWNTEHMRYKCAQWGMYEITGCQSAKGRQMQKGEVHVEGNIVRGCTEKGMSVGYKESVCGMWGAPECDEVVKKWKGEQKEETPTKVGLSLILTDSVSNAVLLQKSPNSKPVSKNSQKAAQFKSHSPKIEWKTSPSGKVQSGKITHKSMTAWEPPVTNLKTVTIKDGKVVSTPVEISTVPDHLTVPVQTVMRMAPNRKIVKYRSVASH
ncbi:hypothetical protein PFISCL1PPCAC_7960 [Pristionchus fissidentatus]|uniref:Abnormal cell migration protein 18-like fibronectin type I domain-containing protein n=1 Tax=Pristionchus fissidentatus TaxID=1538716 RepID=A0AAV5VEM1_9BILA|nr:hypothetical protein PFISCL1PPCAC_7960 [Pristionchus fissidentatus]